MMTEGPPLQSYSIHIDTEIQHTPPKGKLTACYLEKWALRRDDSRSITEHSAAAAAAARSPPPPSPSR
eukprot:1075696-Pelagomonas_calceolata.AAC.1